MSDQVTNQIPSDMPPMEDSATQVAEFLGNVSINDIPGFFLSEPEMNQYWTKDNWSINYSLSTFKVPGVPDASGAVKSLISG